MADAEPKGVDSAVDPVDEAGIRPGEKRVPLPERFDASLYFIGRILTPWATRTECPRRGDRKDGPICTLVIDPRWAEALTGLSSATHLQVLYWMDEARRDLVLQAPRSSGTLSGTFALRSPVRPNPIASSIVALVGVEGTSVNVRGLDCRTGTPLLDLKPWHGPVDDRA